MKLSQLLGEAIGNICKKYFELFEEIKGSLSNIYKWLQIKCKYSKCIQYKHKAKRLLVIYLNILKISCVKAVEIIMFCSL